MEMDFISEQTEGLLAATRIPVRRDPAKEKKGSNADKALGLNSMSEAEQRRQSEVEQRHREREAARPAKFRENQLEEAGRGKQSELLGAPFKARKPAKAAAQAPEEGDFIRIGSFTVDLRDSADLEAFADSCDRAPDEEDDDFVEPVKCFFTGEEIPCAPAASARGSRRSAPSSRRGSRCRCSSA